jgi:soluble epoxide hydrolase / lipid-phosphate phosphatase
MGIITRHVFMNANDIRFHVTDAGHGFPIMLLHGFPELWYSWRKQIDALAEAGFRVVAPDLRGYGGTDAPDEVDSYTMSNLCEDLLGVCDGLGFDKIAIVGHDCGGALAWQFALRHPERTERVVSLNTPHLAPSSVPQPSALRDRFGLTDATFYQRFFQKPGVAETELEADVRTTFQKIMRTSRYADDLWTFATVGGDGSSLLGKIGMGELLLPKVDVETYVRTFKRTGFRGALNWFRAADKSWEEERALPSHEIDMPAMLIVADKDKLYPAEMAEETRALVKNLRIEHLDCGHWTQQEKPAEVTKLLTDFLGDLRMPSME